MRDKAGLLIFGVLLMFGYGFIPSASAQQQSAGVELKPAIIEDKADPGYVFEREFVLTNKSATPQTYYLVTKDITGVSDAGVPIFADPGAEVTGYEISTWLQFSAEPLTLAPGDSASVPVKILVPDNATPGSHFGGLFVTVEPPKLRQTGAGVGYEVAAIITLRISGDVVESARIREFSTDKLVYGTPQVAFTTRVENPGNVLIRPRGPLEITNMFGKRVGSLIVNDTQGGVFPGVTRQFDTVWSGEGVAFGRYQAVVGLLYGETGALNTVSATVSFWILPVKILAPVLGILSLMLLSIYLGVRIYVRRALEEVATTAGRRIVVRRRKDAHMSYLMVIAVTLLVVTTLFLIGLLIFYA